jgi:hypothetical protein
MLLCILHGTVQPLDLGRDLGGRDVAPCIRGTRVADDQGGSHRNAGASRDSL